MVASVDIARSGSQYSCETTVSVLKVCDLFYSQFMCE